MAALCATTFSAKADTIIGVLNTTGTARISQGSIVFVGGTTAINSPGTSQTGGFVALAGTTATIQNITNPPEPVGPLNVPNFMTFMAAPNISFTLTFLLPGINGAAGCSIAVAAAGQVCTPNLPNQSPFNLQNTSATSSTASFQILGTELDSLTGRTANVVGTFTTPFSNLNYQQILATIAGGGTITTSFSAQFAVTAAAVPEPGALQELMAGLLLVGLGLRHRALRG
jgi:hypothetical protein